MRNLPSLVTMSGAGNDKDTKDKLDWDAKN